MIKTYKNFINNPKIEYWDNGQKRSELWSLNGKYHREDGPAYQFWHSNGQKRIEEWWLNGLIHREDGPAIHFFRDDRKKYEEWYLNGKKYSREEWVEELKKIGSSHYREQKILLDAEKYNI
jgi:hypothetical protein